MSFRPTSSPATPPISQSKQNRLQEVLAAGYERQRAKSASVLPNLNSLSLKATTVDKPPSDATAPPHVANPFRDATATDAPKRDLDGNFKLPLLQDYELERYFDDKKSWGRNENGSLKAITVKDAGGEDQWRDKGLRADGPIGAGGYFCYAHLDALRRMMTLKVKQEEVVEEKNRVRSKVWDAISAKLDDSSDSAHAVLRPYFMHMHKYFGAMKWRHRRKTLEWFEEAYPGAVVPPDQDATWAIYEAIEKEMTDLEDEAKNEKLYGYDGPQPYFMPIMISAPPRKGKSALTLLLISLAVKMGFNVFFSVAPNKIVPLREMKEKIRKLGWDKLGFTYRTIDDLWKQAQKNLEYINDDPGDAKKPSPELIKEVCMLARDTQLILYSSDNFSDVWKIDKVLSNDEHYRGFPEPTAAARGEIDARCILGNGPVVLHVHDEAQTLVKIDSGEDKGSGKILRLLRKHYFNSSNLLCMVSATQLPTLQELMWGDIEAGTRTQAWERSLESRPFLVALKPSNSEYHGVDTTKKYEMDEAAKTRLIERVKQFVTEEKKKTLEKLRVKMEEDKAEYDDKPNDATKKRYLIAKLNYDTTTQLHAQYEYSAAENLKDAPVNLSENGKSNLYDKGLTGYEKELMRAQFISFLTAKQEILKEGDTRTILQPMFISALTRRIGARGGGADWIQHFFEPIVREVYKNRSTLWPEPNRAIKAGYNSDVANYDQSWADTHEGTAKNNHYACAFLLYGTGVRPDMCGPWDDAFMLDNQPADIAYRTNNKYEMGANGKRIPVYRNGKVVYSNGKVEYKVKDFTMSRKLFGRNAAPTKTTKDEKDDRINIPQFNAKDPVKCVIVQPHKKKSEQQKVRTFEDAQQAAAAMRKEGIFKLVVVGYTMLQASLTLQSSGEVSGMKLASLPLYDRNYEEDRAAAAGVAPQPRQRLPSGKYMAPTDPRYKRELLFKMPIVYAPKQVCATYTKNAPVDELLQLYGRAFADYGKATLESGDEYMIEVLAPPNTLNRLKRIADAEKMLASDFPASYEMKDSKGQIIEVKNTVDLANTATDGDDNKLFTYQEPTTLEPSRITLIPKGEQPRPFVDIHQLNRTCLKNRLRIIAAIQTSEGEYKKLSNLLLGKRRIAYGDAVIEVGVGDEFMPDDEEEEAVYNEEDPREEGVVEPGVEIIDVPDNDKLPKDLWEPVVEAYRLALDKLRPRNPGKGTEYEGGLTRDSANNYLVHVTELIEESKGAFFAYLPETEAEAKQFIGKRNPLNDMVKKIIKPVLVTKKLREGKEGKYSDRDVSNYRSAARDFVKIFGAEGYEYSETYSKINKENVLPEPRKIKQNGFNLNDGNLKKAFDIKEWQRVIDDLEPLPDHRGLM